MEKNMFSHLRVRYRDTFSALMKSFPACIQSCMLDMFSWQLVYNSNTISAPYIEEKHVPLLLEFMDLAFQFSIEEVSANIGSREHLRPHLIPETALAGHMTSCRTALAGHMTTRPRRTGWLYDHSSTPHWLVI